MAEITIIFEDIDPWVNDSGDTGRSARLKLKRNFEKIKAWMDAQGLVSEFYIRKDIEDHALQKITFDRGAEFGVFTPDERGAAIWQDQKQNWHIESDFLHARKKLIAKEVQIEEVTHVGGQQLSTAAAMVCAFVVDKGSYWRCFFVKVGTDGRIVTNKWKTGDQAYVKTFNLTDENQTDPRDHYLWRLVVGTSIPTPDDSTYTVDGETVIAKDYAIGETIDASGYHYIDLSKEDCDSDSDAPLPGDNIVQLGYRPNDDSSRRNAVIIAGAGQNSPYIYIITGINSFYLPQPEIQLKPGDNRFTGVVNMQAGSSVDGSTLGGTDLLARFTALGTGIAEALTAATQAQLDAINAQGTADGAQNSADQAQGTADQALNGLTNLRTGNENLVVNGGFAGSYESESVESTTTINSGTTIFSDPFGHWDVHNGCTIVNAMASATGLACQLSSGLLKQTVSRALTSGTTYTFSLLGIASGSVTVSIGGASTTIAVTAGKRSFWTFEASSTSAELQVSGSATITELQLIEGNIQLTDWTPSPLDNNRYLSYYKNVAYLLDAIENASTTVLGGLILTQMIRVGNHSDRVMQQETGGMNGGQVNDNSPFLWGGGNFTQALETIAQYNNDPLFQPTQAQLANMAKFVVTHGGRAILTDIILRGYIYAEGGIFKSVQSKNGNWSLDEQGNMTCQDATIKGNQYTPMFRLTAENYATVITDASTINPQIDLTKTGLNVVVESIPSGARRRVILPQTGEEWNGARFHIVNNCPQAAEIGFLVGPIFYWRQDPDTGEVYKDRDFTVINVYLGGSATFVAVLQENGVDIEWHLLSLTDGLHYVHPE